MINIARLLHSSPLLFLLLLPFSSYAYKELEVLEGIARCGYTYPPCDQWADNDYKWSYEYRGVSVSGPWFPSLGGSVSPEWMQKIKPCRIELHPRIEGYNDQPWWMDGTPPAGFTKTQQGTYFRLDERNCLEAVADLGVGIGTFKNMRLYLPGYYKRLARSIRINVTVQAQQYDYLYKDCTVGRDYWQTCDATPVVPNYTCSIDIPPTIDMGLIGITAGPSEYSEQIKIQCSGPTVPNAVVLKIENETTAIGDGVLTSKFCNEQGASCSSSVTTGVNSLVVMKFVAAGFSSPGLKSGNVIVTSSYN
ncbi:hypothetical protein U0L13_000786 [Providencia stuartii]|uniref:hypothetical protein n=1 Tax=Providencia stuartii TaxID=588 RepID=UPI001FF3BD18|nr:hypothetical protein [Providencia stuartii]ELZ5938625.1 hypothetical protein [Providencia stuartii]MCK1144481.1 hypothetical protein [Providencia stuartii]